MQNFPCGEGEYRKIMVNNHEIMSESYGRRSWKGIACAVLVIAAMAAIIAVIVVFAGPAKANDIPGTLELSNVIKGVYTAKSFNGTWISDTEYSYLHNNNIMIYDVPTLKSQVLIDNNTLDEVDAEDFFISPDKEYVLLSYNSSKVYRHSSDSRYKIYEVKSKEIRDLNNGTLLQYANWGPTNSQIVFVFDNNLWYKKSAKDAGLPIQVTNDGEPGIIYNGIPDWVYEEEVLASSTAIWWAEDGSKFAFIKFNDTEVPIMNYMKYGSFSRQNVYPEVVQLRYPKPGRENPLVTLYLVDVSTPEIIKEMKPPTEISGEYYISSVAWAKSDSLSVTWVPRIQNRSLVSFCNSNSLTCVKNSEEVSRGWVDSGVDPVFADDGSAYFLIKAFEDNYRHLTMYNTSNGKATFLTNGTYEVTSILFYDSANKTVYYSRTEVNSPSSRQIARVSTDTPLVEDCLTCGLDEDRKCKYYTAQISMGGTYMVLKCAGGESLDVIPYVDIRKLPENSLVIRLESNERLKNMLLNQTLCDYKRIVVPYPEGYEALVRLYVPKDFNENNKYPLLISVYGGPGTQAIANTFSVNYGTYIASVKKYIYAEIDGRGSAFRGNKLMFEMYKRLGTVEIQDQIGVAQYLASNYRYIDPSKMAIWGWSYGGYASAMALANGNDTFKCGMSVAPVTSWYYYDSIYTERYMLTPEENLKAYDDSGLIKRAPSFKNKKYLLIHGTGDDNVHVQQSMMFMKALNKAGVLFDTHLYPDEAHSISGSSLHVYRTLDQFLDECFA